MPSVKKIIRAIKRYFSPKYKLFPNIAELYDILGFYPSDYNIYKLAFVHRSATLTRPNGSAINNERLEYLGDAVLDLVIADLLFHKFPYEDEGFLTQMRSKIVSREMLSSIAKTLGVHKLLVYNSSISLNNNKSILGDAFEALIGAVYIDKGYNTTRDFIINRIIQNYIDLSELENTETNFKSKLIEWGQKYKKDVSFYTDLEAYDSKNFVSYVRIDDEVYGSGKGKSKKEAEQNAARETLIVVDKPEDE